MSFKNCPICGALFEQQDCYEVCAECFAQNEKQFAMVRDYLYENPNKSILEVANATGVPIDKIMQFLRHGRLTSSL